VAAASGLSTKDGEINDIADFISGCDDLYWDRGDPPDLRQTKFDCGSHAALMAMVVDAAQELFSSPLVIYQMTEVLALKEGQMAEGNLKCYPLERCDNMEAFLDVHSADVTRLKNKLRRFRKPVGPH
jgi:hypothetical protein